MLTKIIGPPLGQNCGKGHQHFLFRFPISQVRNLRPREGKSLTHSHTARTYKARNGLVTTVLR